MIEAARAFVAALGHADAVGVFTLARGGAAHRADDGPRGRAANAQTAWSASAQSMPGHFNLSPSEIVDIMAETGGMGAPPVQTSAPTRGLPVPLLDDGSTLQQVQARECRATSDLGCAEAIVSEASLLARRLEEQITQSLRWHQRAAGAAAGRGRAEDRRGRQRRHDRERSGERHRERRRGSLRARRAGGACGDAIIYADSRGRRRSAGVLRGCAVGARRGWRSIASAGWAAASSTNSRRRRAARS